MSIKDVEEACRPYCTITVFYSAFGHTGAISVLWSASGHTGSKSSSVCGHSSKKVDLQEQRE